MNAAKIAIWSIIAEKNSITNIIESLAPSPNSNFGESNAKLIKIPIKIALNSAIHKKRVSLKEWNDDKNLEIVNDKLHDKFFDFKFARSIKESRERAVFMCYFEFPRKMIVNSVNKNS